VAIFDFDRGLAPAAIGAGYECADVGDFLDAAAPAVMAFFVPACDLAVRRVSRALMPGWVRVLQGEAQRSLRVGPRVPDPGLGLGLWVRSLLWQRPVVGLVR
jgi:hypothetical protein